MRTTLENKEIDFKNFEKLSLLIIEESYGKSIASKKFNIDTIRKKLKKNNIELNFETVYTFFHSLGKMREYAETIAQVQKKATDI